MLMTKREKISSRRKRARYIKDERHRRKMPVTNGKPMVAPGIGKGGIQQSKKNTGYRLYHNIPRSQPELRSLHYLFFLQILHNAHRNDIPEKTPEDRQRTRKNY